MKTTKRSTEFNFVSTLAMETTLDPHEVYTALAIDATLAHFNADLPNLSAEESQRIMDAATTAAKTVLALARVPNDWLSIVEALHRDRQAKLRSEIAMLVLEAMPDRVQELSGDRVAAIERVRRCCSVKSLENLHEAMLDLELAIGGEMNDLIEAAFALGYQVAHDPTRLIFEETTKTK